MRDCPRVRQDLPAYLSDNLPLTRRSAISAHLQICAECQRELSSVRRLSEALDASRPAEPEPPTDLWARLEASLPPSAAMRASQPRALRLSQPGLLLGSALALIFALILWNKHSSEDSGQPSAAGSGQARMMKASTRAAGSSAARMRTGSTSAAQLSRTAIEATKSARVSQRANSDSASAVYPGMPGKGATAKNGSSVFGPATSDGSKTRSGPLLHRESLPAHSGATSEQAALPPLAAVAGVPVEASTRRTKASTSLGSQAGGAAGAGTGMNRAAAPKASYKLQSEIPVGAAGGAAASSSAREQPAAVSLQVPQAAAQAEAPSAAPMRPKRASAPAPAVVPPHHLAELQAGAKFAYKHSHPPSRPQLRGHGSALKAAIDPLVSITEIDMPAGEIVWRLIGAKDRTNTDGRDDDPRRRLTVIARRVPRSELLARLRAASHVSVRKAPTGLRGRASSMTLILRRAPLEEVLKVIGRRVPLTYALDVVRNARPLTCTIAEARPLLALRSVVRAAGLHLSMRGGKAVIRTGKGRHS